MWHVNWLADTIQALTFGKPPAYLVCQFWRIDRRPTALIYIRHYLALSLVELISPRKGMTTEGLPVFSGNYLLPQSSSFLDHLGGFFGFSFFSPADFSRSGFFFFFDAALNR
jgi:hypothetical protein